MTSTSLASARQQLPELDLPAFDAELFFGEVLGRGTRGATVLRCSFVPLPAGDPGDSGGSKGHEATSEIKSAAGPADAALVKGTAMAEAAVPRTCAAKVLPLSLAVFPSMVEDLGREVAVLRRLGPHPGLVSFIGATRLMTSPVPGACEAYVLCVELCDAALDTAVVRRRALCRSFAPAELGCLLSQVAGALAYLHEQGIVHRDLQSSNVLLRRLPSAAEDCDVLEAPLTELQAKIGDLGSCKVPEDAEAPEPAAWAPVLPTPVLAPPWTAPEVRRFEGHGAPSDVWSFGALIFELLELGAPNGEDASFQQLDAQLPGDIPPALSDPDEAELCCPGFVALMADCFAVEPAARPTAAGIVQRLADHSQATET